MLLEQKAKELVRKVVNPPVVGFRKLMWTAAGLYLLGTILPLTIPYLNYAKYSGPLQTGSFETSTPLTGGVFEIFALGQFFGPFQSLKSAGSVSGGVASFVVDAFIAPPMLFAGIFVGMILTALPVVIAVMLISGWDKYLRLVGFSYPFLYGFFYFALATNSVTITPRFGLSVTILASVLVITAGLDRAKNWAIIKNNVVGASRGYVYKPYAGKVSTDDMPD